MDNQQYPPYDSAQNPGESSAQNSNTSPHAQNPYGQNGYGQNPYGGNPYGQSPYTPPYTQRQPYNQNPYAQAPYGQGYYGGAPYNGYTMQNDPNFLQKKKETRTLHTMSMSHGLAVIGFTILAYVVSALLAMIPGFRSAYTGNSVFSEAVDAAFSLFIIFVPFFLNFLFQKKRGILKELPLGTPNDGKAAVLLVFIGVMCCVAGSYATSILTAMFESVFGVTFTMPESNVVYNSVPMVLLAVLGTAIVPAFVEEFAIRGTVMQPLRKYGDNFAIVMSALVFALMHGNMVQIPFAFIAGIAIGYAVTITGSMWVGIAIHFLNNFASVLMQVAVDNLPDKQENIVILAILALILIAGIVSLIFYLKNYVRAPLEKGGCLLQNGEKAKAYLCTVPMIFAAILLLIETAQYIEF
ncbi:MAG: type II CAAX prenyl endopeptidase Rce1 family protein [Candidatus Fimenecus sp.]